ncbi:hypothetical protein NN3_45000 [Nocardia neocaledoniensis NBRC 108232]|uniref:Uncharacterized protein (UPF0548 family) n=1 Tax=Nocardia neocaledoniensis TaxID=236511 RepID=A0A317P1L7_9NOCA|nr:DUF1990 domain-containing protein [Nocardia neocaledoniensis]PWV81337.1 uncharacterized protein (UPF0548 family) [Nocardia neocaledoniensis]GEM33493.1 hypothetical protein NN3_45000 [Nocardia neocaledoniensis NBRC 108232]
MADNGVPFTYPDVGATRTSFPAGYQQLRHRRLIGHGRDLFERAAAHIFDFGMQKGVGIFQHADTETAEAGTALTVRLGIGPIGITAPCRIVYVLHEPNRRGFAYGTLPGHPEIGEELFAVEYDPTDESVHGLVTAFSRPGAWYTRLGGPIPRGFQRWFAHRYLKTLPNSH